MFDIGLGEFIALAVIALIVFGPDRLPKAAAQGGRALRQLREMATNARKELGDSAGLDTITEEWKSLQELHPKRIISSALEAPAEPASGASGPATPVTPAAPAATTAEAGSQPPSAAAPSAKPAQAPGQPGATQSSPTSQSAGYDPDAT